MKKYISRWVAYLVIPSVLVIVFGTNVSADQGGDYADGATAQPMIHGQPANLSDAWIVAAGGRIYDNWWNALGRAKPTSTHPSYPDAGGKEDSTTWRCKECHGWDYKGVNGVYGKGSHYSGIKGIDGAAGMSEVEVATIIRNPDHGYTKAMITDDELARIAAFVSRGQIDMSQYIDLETRTIIAGDADRGRGVFQTVCAACHGFDGRLLDWGDEEEHAYVGTEAMAAPDEVLHKIQNAHPGVAMVNLRSFPEEYAVDVLRYATTLPTE